jgi:hypothetical protein
MKKILVTGDSFATVWPFTKLGWSNLLAHRHDVTNLSQAGCGEYKILKQIESVSLSEFDLVIVSHTSPSRIHTPSHPLHKEGFHKNCDLLANDICGRTSWFNPSLRTAQGWFKYHYDEQYQIDIYNLIRKRIQDLLGKIPYISLTHTDISRSLIIESNNIDFSDLWKRERGSINHYTIQGNRIIFETIIEHIGGK